MILEVMITFYFLIVSLSACIKQINVYLVYSIKLGSLGWVGGKRGLISVDWGVNGAEWGHGLLKYPECQLQNTVKLAEAEKCLMSYFLIELSFWPTFFFIQETNYLVKGRRNFCLKILKLLGKNGAIPQLGAKMAILKFLQQINKYWYLIRLPCTKW